MENTTGSDAPQASISSNGLAGGDVAVGPDLDAEVAVHLFGYKWMLRFSNEVMLVEPEIAFETEGWKFAPDPLPEGCELVSRQLMPIPAYSTTGDGMMLVLERLRKTGRLVAMFVYDDESKTGMEKVSVRCPSKVSDDYNVHIKGTALPEAVCRAALRMIETERANKDYAATCCNNSDASALPTSIGVDQPLPPSHGAL